MRLEKQKRKQYPPPFPYSFCYGHWCIFFLSMIFKDFTSSPSFRDLVLHFFVAVTKLQLPWDTILWHSLSGWNNFLSLFLPPTPRQLLLMSCLRRITLLKVEGSWCHVHKQIRLLTKSAQGSQMCQFLWNGRTGIPNLSQPHHLPHHDDDLGLHCGRVDCQLLIGLCQVEFSKYLCPH